MNLATGMRVDIWKNKEAFLEYYYLWKNKFYVNNYLIDLWFLISDDENVLDLFKEFPYLIFTDEEYLYDLYWIQIILNYDKYIFSAMLEINDEKLNDFIYNKRMIKNAVVTYHSVLDFSLFEKYSLLEEIICEDELFLYTYFTILYEKILNTKEGNDFYRLYFNKITDNIFYMMVDYLMEYSNEDLVSKLYSLKGLEECIEINPPKGFPLTDQELLDLIEYIGLDFESLDSDFQNALVDCVIRIVESGNKEELESVLEEIDLPILRQESMYYKKYNFRYHSNFKFYIECARKGKGVLLYSKYFSNDASMWLKLLYVNPSLISCVPKGLLCKSDFVIRCRYFCEDVLLYCNPCLLISEEFMLEYLKRFKTSGYFRLDSRLPKNQSFLDLAVKIDEHILFYVSDVDSFR